MMTTILWTAYLAVLLFFTISLLVNNAAAALGRRKTSNGDLLMDGLICIMWAIWYIFFLH